MTLQSHNANQSNLQWRIYSNGSKKDENVINAMINFNWNKKKRLKDIDITITHYDKFKELIMIVKELIKYYEKAMNVCNKIYKIYFDSQASLKVIHIILSMFD